ncbi:carbohydrate-binding module family 13 protein [Rhizophagus clarus]|uniref:Carbohydrate-binding module family 13 protein n=1 Tax=Rhizophagus clarus TaxID=94130 RepID=A0A8H3R509_9GLOM|nr:carbohydrate-binding module family 13 protein [Rhizophagus clarus]
MSMISIYIMVIIQTLVNIVPNLNPNMKVYMSELYMGYYSDIMMTKITHKTPIAEVDDQTVKLKEELSYNILPATRAIELTDNRSAIQPHPHPHPPYPYYNPSLPPPLLPSSLQSYNSNNQYYPYYPYPNYNPSSYSQISSEKDKELVQPNLPQLINTDEPQNNNFKDKKRGGKRSGKTKSAKALIRKSPRKKGAIMNIVMEKIIEIPSADEDEIQEETKLKKSESFMDTESDYHTQTEEMPDVFQNKERVKHPYVKKLRACTYKQVSRVVAALIQCLLADRPNNDGILAHIKLPNISPEIFQIILRYIYGGRLFLEKHDDSDIIKILVAANEFEKCLISLIQHENSQKNTIQVWEHVLKWGISQNPELPSDPLNYSKDDFNTLKNSLQQCILLIKFYNLTSKEFVEKVYPYKKIIPKELREKLIKDFIYQQNKKPELEITKEISSKNIDSKIIKYQHTELISNWIDRLDTTLDSRSNPYEFKLMLRGSRDGFSSNKFHEICDNQSHTISIIKVKDSTEILGGYNPIIWKSNDSYGNTKDSFIFSFKNKDNIEDYSLSRVKIGISTTYNSVNYGPAFTGGLVLCGSNFYNKSYCCGNIKYYNKIRKTDYYFSVEEYEIFQITKD